MSVILDALRRSEAERQRGKAPGLFVEQAARPARRRRATWLPALAGAAAVALLAAGAFWWMQRGAPAPVPRTATPEPATADQATPHPPAVVSSSAPAPAVPETMPPAPVVAPAPVPAPRPAAVPARAEGTASAQAAEAPLSPQPTAAVVDTPAPPAPARPDEDAAEPPLPRLVDLPPEERQALPPLKLSMHVFADDPAQRFVILDGRRQSEGAQPAPGVVIERIRRDGVVLAVNGRRVLLGRP